MAALAPARSNRSTRARRTAPVNQQLVRAQALSSAATEPLSPARSATLESLVLAAVMRHQRPTPARASTSPWWIRPCAATGTLELDEPCDVKLGTLGCTNCKVDAGYECPAYDTCILVPICGDGKLQLGEECDVGLVSAPACIGCKVQSGYYCVGAGSSSCIAPECGNRKVEGLEACDDGDKLGGDGCSADCSTIETGFVCPPGADCQPVCGDGIVAFTGGESCEASAPGCVGCQVQPSYDCGITGKSCILTTCGKNGKERGEYCDYGDTIAGDGCGPTCQVEPKVTAGTSRTVEVTCGDGLITNGEGCDDGNQLSGDGCSSSCAIEYGWTCKDQYDYPSSIDFKDHLSRFPRSRRS